MRKYGRVLALGAVCIGAVALADPHDVRLHRLGNPELDAGADAAFRTLTRQLGAALTSANLAPPSTLGHSGFAVHLELSVVSLQAVPPGDPALGSGAFIYPSEGNVNFTRSPLLVPSIHVRKGFPFSVEVGTRVAWIEKSRMYAGTFELKGAVIEGFAYLPDVGIRGHMTRLFNTRDFELTTTGVDVGVGKPFAIGGMITLTPYAGWDLAFVSADSTRIDFAQDRSPAEALSGPTALPANTATYASVSANVHNRLYAGVRFIGGVIQLGAELSFAALGDAPQVTAFNTTVGLDF